MADPAPHVRFEHITKRYDGVVALDGVSFEIERGHIHALVGENGAGKSTLGKILTGSARPDGGTLNIAGQALSFRAPREALGHGIALVHQEISLVQTLSTQENVLMGVEGARRGLLSRRALRRRFDELMDETGYSLNPEATVGSLPLAEQQKVEIVRAVARRAELIVFDEPTAPLTQDEADQLYKVLRHLREQGLTLVYVSHFLDEVLELSDSVSILKDGHHLRTGPAAAETVDSLITGMLGRSLEATFPDKRPAPPDAPIVLRAEGLTRKGVVENASLEVRAGEILGLAGLVGSGRTELARLIFGRDSLDAGQLELHGEACSIRSPRKAISSGIAYLPESRKDQALLLGRCVRENITLAHLGDFARFGVVNGARERKAAEAAISDVQLRPGDPDRPAGTLSGGNQQKVVFGRWLMRRPDVLIADEPTRGIDVGAKRALYDLLVSLAAEGMAIVVISSDLEEVMGLAHRILVMHRGRIVQELEGYATEGQILAGMFGEGEAAIA